MAKDEGCRSVYDGKNETKAFRNAAAHNIPWNIVIRFGGTNLAMLNRIPLHQAQGIACNVRTTINW